MILALELEEGWLRELLATVGAGVGGGEGLPMSDFKRVCADMENANEGIAIS